jgi:hypothetical protein
MALYKNSGLRLSMQSAIAAAKTISGITNAAPGVISSTGHGYSDGDIVLLEVQGMTELNNRLFVVSGSATDSFQLEDVEGTGEIDTTSYGTFSSGTAKKVTLGTSITGTQGFAPSGGDVKFLDTTTVQDTSDTQEANGFTAQSYQLTQQWDPADSAQLAMIEASRLGERRAFRIMWPNGRFVLFYGTVGYKGAPGGENQGVTTAPAALALSGEPTYGKQ